MKNINKTRKQKKYKSKKRVFTKKQYYSGDGMLTTVWGPSLWHYLHTMSFNYPIKPTAKDKIYYKQFILNLKNVLPCKYCRINLKNNFKHMPLKSCHMKNRETFSRYVYNLHEFVNKMLKKKSNLSYCDVSTLELDVQKKKNYLNLIRLKKKRGVLNLYMVKRRNV